MDFRFLAYIACVQFLQPLVVRPFCVGYSSYTSLFSISAYRTTKCVFVYGYKNKYGKSPVYLYVR